MPIQNYLNFTLSDFKALAGGDTSIGYLTLDANKQVVKAGHHKTLTNLNVKPAALNEADSRALRMQLYGAIKKSLTDTSGKLSKDAQTFLGSVARQLGLHEEGTFVEQTVPPLDRRTVRALVQATEKLCGQKTSPVMSPTEAHRELAAFLKGKSNDSGSKVPLNVLASLTESVGKLSNDKNGGIHWIAGIRSGESISVEKTFDGKIAVEFGGQAFTFESAERLRQQCALAVVAHPQVQDAQLQDLVNGFTHLFNRFPDPGVWSGVKSEESRTARAVCLEILKNKLESLNIEELSTVPVSLMWQLAEIALSGGLKSAATLSGILQQYDSPKLTENETLAILKQYSDAARAEQDKVVLPAPKQPLSEQEIAELPPKDRPPSPVQMMLADIVSDARCFLADQYPEPGARLQRTLQDHATTLFEFLKNPEREIAKLPALLRNVAQTILDQFKEKVGDQKDQLTKIKLHFALLRQDTPEKLAKAEKVIDAYAQNACYKLQHRLNVAFSKALNPQSALKPQNVPDAKQLIEGDGPLNDDDGYDEFIDQLFPLSEPPQVENQQGQKVLDKSTDTDKKKILDLVDEYYDWCFQSAEVQEEKRQRTFETFVTRATSTLKIGVSPAYARKHLEGLAKLPTGTSNAQHQAAPLQAGKKNLVEFMTHNKMPQEKIDALNQKKPIDDLDEKRMEASRELLEKLGTPDDQETGYLAFMSQVMKRYLREMPLTDKRAMLAAGLRFSKVGGDEAQMMGAVLKGAGPIMQKMLQGLASMNVSQDLLTALDDMKSNLPDIPKEVVQAHLLEMVKQSNGKIASVELKKSLGAASVGQAFLCTVTLNETDANKVPKTKDVVIKLLRPEIEARASHERKLFVDVSKEVNGMKKTFEFQLAGILDELDFRKEAQNTKAGSVYDTGETDVKSMKLLDLVAPTKHMMVVEKAPGTTVDRLIKDIETKIDELTAPFYDPPEEVVDKNGNTVTQRKPKTVFAGDDHRNLAENYGKAIAGLAKLYQTTLVQQKRLLTLTRKWTLQGVYQSGYFHGDLHAGNIMVDDEFKRDADGNLLSEENGGLTVIDFGNAQQLTTSQQENIIRMMTAATLRDTNRFMENFRVLLSEEGRQRFDAEPAHTAIHDLIHNIFNLGNEEDVTNRIFAVLQQLQAKGFELPGPIFRFSQCATRLQGTVEQVNNLLKRIERKTAYFRRKVSLQLLPDSNDSMPEGGDPYRDLLVKHFNPDLKPSEVDCDFLKMLDEVEDGFDACEQSKNRRDLAKVDENSFPEKGGKAGPAEILLGKFADGNGAFSSEESQSQPIEKLIKLMYDEMSKFAPSKEEHETVQSLFDSLVIAINKRKSSFVKMNTDLENLNVNLSEVQQLKNAVLEFKSKIDLLTDIANAKTDLQRISFLENKECDLRNRLNVLYAKRAWGLKVDADEIKRLEILLNWLSNLGIGLSHGEKIEDVIEQERENLQVTKDALSGKNQEPETESTDVKAIKEQYVNAWNEDILPELKAWVNKFEDIQWTHLGTLRDNLKPLRMKNEQGVVVRKLEPAKKLLSFADSVGKVIMDHKLCSLFRLGGGLGANLLWKNFWGDDQVPV